MNTFTEQEKHFAWQLHGEASRLARIYAGQQDHRAATVALLVEALILAGGAFFLKPTKE
jgi:hypothetical protein